MATEMNPPHGGDVVVQVSDEAVESFKAAGWTETKAKRSTRKSDDK